MHTYISDSYLRTQHPRRNAFETREVLQALFNDEGRRGVSHHWGSPRSHSRRPVQQKEGNRIGVIIIIGHTGAKDVLVGPGRHVAVIVATMYQARNAKLGFDQVVPSLSLTGKEITAVAS